MKKSLELAQPMVVTLNSVSIAFFSIRTALFGEYLECLFHGKDVCPDCLAEKNCGDTQQTNDCDFMKQSMLKKLVAEHTADIKGSAINDIFSKR